MGRTHFLVELKHRSGVGLADGVKAWDIASVTAKDVESFIQVAYEEAGSKSTRSDEMKFAGDPDIAKAIELGGKAKEMAIEAWTGVGLFLLELVGIEFDTACDFFVNVFRDEIYRNPTELAVELVRCYRNRLYR